MGSMGADDISSLPVLWFSPEFDFEGRELNSL
jgi:hypothetical protein